MLIEELWQIQTVELYLPKEKQKQSATFDLRRLLLIIPVTYLTLEIWFLISSFSLYCY